MTNTKKLRARIKDRGLLYGYLAQQLGITPYCLSQKIDNKTEFRASEIHKLAQLLDMTLDEKEAFFFEDKVERDSTLFDKGYNRDSAH